MLKVLKYKKTEQLKKRTIINLKVWKKFKKKKLITTSLF